MKLCVRTRYAIRLLAELARHSGMEPRNAAQLSAATGVPEPFIVQVMTPLRKAGMVASVRGAAGGHVLLAPAEGITLGDVYRATQGEVRITDCATDHEACPNWTNCPTRPVWRDVSLALEQTLDSYTLADIASR